MQILITGASRGIGMAIALKLQFQFKLILHASSLLGLDTLFENLEDPGKHERIVADLADPIEVKTFCAEIRRRFSDDLFCVINNAGITLDKSLLYQPETDIDRLLQVNLKAPIMISKMAFKIFRVKEKGIIINIGSCVGELGNAFQCVYAASKAGLVAFSKSLAREAGVLLPNHSIRVFIISPGYIETGMTMKIPEMDKMKYVAGIPTRRMGQPSEIASLVSFLVSGEGDYLNGSEIRINGGIV